MLEVRKNDILAIAILVLIIVIRFSPFLFLGKPLNTDSWKAYYPWHNDYKSTQLQTINYDSNMEYGTWFPMVKEKLSRGEFPLWNEFSGCGMPMYGDHLIPVFHVPFAVALLFPNDLILAAYSFLLALIGTLFFYWFLRNWKFNQFVSLFGSLVFFLSGWIMYLYPPEVVSFIWIPAILLFHDRFLASNRLSDACWGAFFTGQLLIGGYPGMIVHFFYFAAIYVFWRRFHLAFQWNTSITRWLFALLIMTLLGISISAVQNYPTYIFSSLTSRDLASESKMFLSASEFIEEKKSELSVDSDLVQNNLTFADKILEKIQVRSITTIPVYHPDFNLTRNHTGPLVMLVSLIGLLFADRRFRVMKLCFLIYGLFFVAPPIFGLIAPFIPGWSISALLPREIFFFIVYFMFAVGLNQILNKIPNIRKSMLLLPSILALIIILPVALHPSFPTPNYMGFIRWSILHDSIFVIFWLILSIMTLTISLMLINRNLYRNNLRLQQILLVLYCITALSTHFYMFPYFHSKNIMPQNESIEQIQKIIGNERFTRYGTDEPRLAFDEWLTYILPPNTASRFKMLDTLGYNNMRLESHETFMKNAAPGTIIRERGEFHVLGHDSLKPYAFFAQATGTRFVMEKFDEPLNYPYSRDVHEISGMRIYNLYKPEFDGSLQVRLFTNYILESNFDGDLLNDNFMNLIILAEPPTLNDGTLIEPNHDFQSISFKPLEFIRESQKLSVTFDAPYDSILYIADSYHPFWKAALNNEEVPILRANLKFRAVAVPAGINTLHMWYEPKDLIAGGFVSGLSLIILLILAFVETPRKSDDHTLIEKLNNET